MPKETETKEELTKQLDKLKKELEDFRADISIDKDAKKIVADAMDEAIKTVEEKLAEMPD